MKPHHRIDRVRMQTDLLRTGTGGRAIGIRRCLAEKGIDVAAGFVAEWFPDDPSFDFGVFVTASGGVFQFGYDYLRQPESEGAFREWVDLTASWQESPYTESVAAAFEVLKATHIDEGRRA
jgi:hypothetical protein